MPSRRCLGTPGNPCGALGAWPRGRCPTCQQVGDRKRWATLDADPVRQQRKVQRYDSEWRRYSKQARAEHVAAHGWMCPGYADRQPHPTTDLVTDHDLGVMCRSCNALKANTTDRMH